MKLQKIYSKAQRRRTPVPPQKEVRDSGEENGLYKHSDELVKKRKREGRRQGDVNQKVFFYYKNWCLFTKRCHQ